MITDYIAPFSSSACNLISCSHLTLKKFKIEKGFLDYWEIIIVISGSFSCKTDNNTEILKSGDVIFMPAFQQFERTIIEKLDFYHIRFMPNDSKSISANLPSGKIEFVNIDRINSTIEILIDIHKGMFDGYRDIEQHLLNDIFYQYYVEHRLKNFNKSTLVYDATVYRTINYFSEHLSENIKIYEIAQKCGITPTGLILKFKRVTGLSPVNYLIALRMSLARQLLQESSLNIAEIAIKCGYENAYYFSNAFKKHNNMSPTIYKKKFII